MGRRARRAQSVAISLFSFQDIMMTVMGILLLIALLLALQLTDAVDAAASQDGGETTTRVDGLMSPAELDAMAAEVDAMRESLNEKRASYDRALLGESLREDHIESARQRVEELAESLAESQDKIDQAEAILEDAEDQSDDRVATAASAVVLREKIESLEAELDEQGRAKRLTYLVDENTGKQPILVEFSATLVGIGSPKRPEEALWLTGDDMEAQIQAVVELAGGRDPRSEYFVILLKPSAFQHYDALRAALTKAKFQVGTELVPEDAFVLEPPGSGR